MNEKQQYIYWLEQQRRKMSLYNAIQIKIGNIARFIVAGGDPSTSPDYKDDYNFLITEFGSNVFESEINRLLLIKEEDYGR